MSPTPRIGYLFSRYPFRSQTFTDNEMLGLEARGWNLVAASVHPPVESFRQPNLDRLRAPVLYGPPRAAVEALEQEMRREGSWPEAMVQRHEETYGPSFQSALRASNACYFARQFRRMGVTHVHVPFANRALHTALFLREMTGITLSFTTHGQDFMVDLGSKPLLAEMCAAAEFVVAVCDYSKDLLREWCPESRDRIVRVYNGLDPADFTPHPLPAAEDASSPLRVLSVGRLIEFKGFHFLIEAVALAASAGVRVELRIVGEGPWREQLETQIVALGITDRVELCGVLSSAEIRREIQNCHLFALACVVDSKGASDLLPTVITEAMLGGRAVLGTTVAGVPEMVVHETTGILVPPANAQALADAMVRAHGEREVLLSMGISGRSRAETLFSLEVTIRQLEAHLRRAAQVAAYQTVRSAGIYDLSLPGRDEWVESEALCLDETVLCGDAKKSPTLPDAVWLPDGMVLEMEWRARETWRRQLEMLRTELSTAVDGEIFLEAARRAVWLCAGWERTEFPRLLFAAGNSESLCAWLCHWLLDIPCALSFDEGWNGVLLRRMASDAVAVSNATDRLPETPDALRRGDATLTPAERRENFASWIQPLLSHES